jgi:hypothetical protein
LFEYDVGKLLNRQLQLALIKLQNLGKHIR